MAYLILFLRFTLNYLVLLNSVMPVAFLDWFYFGSWFIWLFPKCGCLDIAWNTISLIAHLHLLKPPETTPQRFQTLQVRLLGRWMPRFCRNLLTITWSVHPYFLQLPHWIWLLSNPVTFKCQGTNFPPFTFLEISSFVNLCRYNSTKVMISGSLLAMEPLECRTHLGLASFTFYVSNHTSIILKLFYFIGVNQFGCDVFLVFGFVFFFLTGRLKRSNQQPRPVEKLPPLPPPPPPLHHHQCHHHTLYY